MPVLIGGSGITFSNAEEQFTLNGAEALLIPAGPYFASPGRYTSLEWFDPILGIWRANSVAGSPHIFNSDGTNFRLINRTGTPVGAVVTNKGSAYTSAPAVAVSTGGSLWKAIVGGAFNTTITVTTAGVYNYPPTLVFPAPPAGGVQASGYCVMSGTSISSVTLTNRGAGYTKVPTSVNVNNSGAVPFNPQSNQLQIVQDPRDTAAGGGVLTVNATLADATAVTAVICTDPGNTALTAVPTLTFSGGGGSSAAATVTMNFSVTGFTVGTAGAAYGTSLPFIVTGAGLFSQATPFSGDSNPQVEIGLTKPRNFWISGTSTGGGAVTATGALIDDAGWGIQRVPDGVVLTGQLITTAAVVTMTVGATIDTSILQPLKL